MKVRFVELCRRGLKVNADKSKVVVMHGLGRLECECRGRKVVSGSRVRGAIKVSG